MKDRDINQIKYKVSGMHCASCQFFVENTAKKLPGVEEVKADLASSMVTLNIDPNIDQQDFINKFNHELKDSDYMVHHIHDTQVNRINLQQLVLGFAVSIIIFGLYISLQKSGVVKLPDFESIGLFSIFIIGVIASISSCMAVVGGLALSMSSFYSQQYGQKYAKKSMMMFHLSRLGGFFIFGMMIGYLGSFINFSTSTERIIDSILSVIMILIGINMLGISSKIGALQLRFPKKFADLINNQSQNTKFYGPMIFGALTFFMPCGFTQAMQFYSISLGDSLRSGTTMFIFALGTLPALLFVTYLGGNVIRNKIVQYTLAFLIIMFSLNLLIGLV